MVLVRKILTPLRWTQSRRSQCLTRKLIRYVSTICKCANFLIQPLISACKIYFITERFLRMLVQSPKRGKISILSTLINGKSRIKTFSTFYWDVNFMTQLFQLQMAKHKVDDSPPELFPELYLKPRRLDYYARQLEQTMNVNKELLKRINLIQRTGVCYLRYSSIFFLT